MRVARKSVESSARKGEVDPHKVWAAAGVGLLLSALVFIFLYAGGGEEAIAGQAVENEFGDMVDLVVTPFPSSLKVSSKSNPNLERTFSVEGGSGTIYTLAKTSTKEVAFITSDGKKHVYPLLSSMPTVVVLQGGDVVVISGYTKRKYGYEIVLKEPLPGVGPQELTYLIPDWAHAFSFVVDGFEQQHAITYSTSGPEEYAFHIDQKKYFTSPVNYASFEQVAMVQKNVGFSDGSKVKVSLSVLEHDQSTALGVKLSKLGEDAIVDELFEEESDLEISEASIAIAKAGGVGAAASAASGQASDNSEEEEGEQGAEQDTQDVSSAQDAASCVPGQGCGKAGYVCNGQKKCVYKWGEGAGYTKGDSCTVPGSSFAQVNKGKIIWSAGFDVGTGSAPTSQPGDSFVMCCSASNSCVYGGECFGSGETQFDLLVCNENGVWDVCTQEGANQENKDGTHTCQNVGGTYKWVGKTVETQGQEQSGSEFDGLFELIDSTICTSTNVGHTYGNSQEGFVCSGADKAVVCSSENFGKVYTLKKSGEYVQFACVSESVAKGMGNTAKPQWTECNTGGSVFGTGKAVVKGAGDLLGTSLVCSQGNTEAWWHCGEKPTGSKGGLISYGKTREGYSCTQDGWIEPAAEGALMCIDLNDVFDTIQEYYSCSG